MLKPVGAAGVKAALVPLMLTQQLENLDNLPEGFDPAAYLHQKSAEYERHLAHFPLDILRTACDAHVRLSKFFPAVAEIIALAEPPLSERQRQQSRVALLMKGGGQAKPEPFKHDPRDVVLKTLIRHARNRGDTDKAIRYERELAGIEGRPMEAWAVDVPVVGAIVTPPAPNTIKRTAKDQVAVEETRLAKHAMAALGMPLRSSAHDGPPNTIDRSDWPELVDASPEPPPPDEIPESQF